MSYTILYSIITNVVIFLICLWFLITYIYNKENYTIDMDDKEMSDKNEEDIKKKSIIQKFFSLKPGDKIKLIGTIIAFIALVLSSFNTYLIFSSHEPMPDAYFRNACLKRDDYEAQERQVFSIKIGNDENAGSPIRNVIFEANFPPWVKIQYTNKDYFIGREAIETRNESYLKLVWDTIPQGWNFDIVIPMYFSDVRPINPNEVIAPYSMIIYASNVDGTIYDYFRDSI